MAKDTDKKVQQAIKPIATCNQPIQVVTNYDNLKQNNDILSQSEIEGLILTIRGLQVLIDRDLAELFGVKTKRLNEQVNVI